MMRRLLPLVILVVAAALLALAVACGGRSSDSTPTPAPTTSGLPDLSPEVGGVEAARRYLEETGIDGKKGEFTDPRSCAQIDGNTKGKFCVQENFSTYAPGLVILRVANAQKPEDEVWEMRLLLNDKVWQVTEVKPFGGSE